jgi:hypothetical protein
MLQATPMASSPLPAQLSCHLVAGILVPARNDHLCSLLRHAMSYSLADTFGRASDQGNFSFQTK